ncbi:MAG TPA: arylsulfotransferase family protein [Solirubrobacterales bacterium]|nr:arylsulfotransferase family protein [Solirubrobacterales bacterium]
MPALNRHSYLLSLLVAGLTAFASVGCGLDEEAQAPTARSPLSIDGLYPSFDLAKNRYVSRCGRGAAPIHAEADDGVEVEVGSGPPETGAISIEPGVAPGEDFEIAVVDGQRRRAYQVRCLPADFPAWRFERLGEIRPGLFVVSFRASRKERPWVIVFDHQGVPRWWYSPDTRASGAQILSDGTISWARSFGDGYGLDPRMAHEIRSLSGDLLRRVRTRGPIIDGHELRELASGNFLVGSYVPETADLRRFCARPPRERCGPAQAAVVSAEVQELDPQGRLLWHWNSRGKIGLQETGRWWRNVLSNPRRRLGRAAYDPVHINSIEPRGADELVISTRHTDAIYGIRRSSGEIAWKLGGTQTADSLRIVGDPARKLFGGQHDARIAADGILSVYDNGKDRPRRPRVAFYRLEPERGRARYLAQLNDPAVRSSHCCGSARQLEDGGWLVSWGDNPLVTAFQADGGIAFRLRLPVSTYRTVPVPLDAVTPAQLDRGLEAMERSLAGRRNQ